MLLVFFSERRHPVVKASDGSRPPRNRREGATVVEYVLMLALVVIVCLAGVQSIGRINELFFNIGSTI
jgi:Flp pilus assembly pilin Flp